jgi:hypothetical protein
MIGGNKSLLFYICTYHVPTTAEIRPLLSISAIVSNSLFQLTTLAWVPAITMPALAMSVTKEDLVKRLNISPEIYTLMAVRSYSI